jgi:RNA 3'-terminal phosphate cyclase (ATP)
VINAPSFEFVQHVLFPFLQQQFGLKNLYAKLIKRGFWPKGGGCLHVSVPALAKGTPIQPINVKDRGEVVCIKGVAYSGRASGQVTAQMREAAVSTLRLLASVSTPNTTGLPLNHINITEDPTSTSLDKLGFGILLWAETSTGCVLSGSAIGGRGESASETGAKAAKELFRSVSHGGCVDEYLQVTPVVPTMSFVDVDFYREQDQIIIFLALAKGRSCVRTGPLTEHTRYGTMSHLLVR